MRKRLVRWTAWIDQWWVRPVMGLITVALWALLTGRLGALGSFPRDAADAEVLIWAVLGTVGFGAMAGAAVVGSPGGRPLLPGWSLAVIGLISFAGLFLFLALADEGARSSIVDGVPKDHYWPHLAQWAPVLALPVTVTIAVVAVAHRLDGKRKSLWSWVSIAVGLAPFPTLAILILVSL